MVVYYISLFPAGQVLLAIETIYNIASHDD